MKKKKIVSLEEYTKKKREKKSLDDFQDALLSGRLFDEMGVVKDDGDDDNGDGGDHEL